MPVTRDAEFPAEIAQLFQAFNRCADGHQMPHIIEAAGNMLSAALHNYASATGLSRTAAVAITKLACEGVLRSVETNLGRRGLPTDVPVREQ